MSTVSAVVATSLGSYVLSFVNQVVDAPNRSVQDIFLSTLQPVGHPIGHFKNVDKQKLRNAYEMGYIFVRKDAAGKAFVFLTDKGLELTFPNGERLYNPLSKLPRTPRPTTLEDADVADLPF